MYLVYSIFPGICCAAAVVGWDGIVCWLVGWLVTWFLRMHFMPFRAANGNAVLLRFNGSSGWI